MLTRFKCSLNYPKSEEWMPSEWSTGLWFQNKVVKLPDSLLWRCKSGPEFQKCWQMSNTKELGFSVSTIDVMLWKLLAVWMSKTTQQLPEPFQVFSKTLKHTTVQHLLHIRCDIKTFVFKTAILCFSMLVFFFFLFANIFIIQWHFHMKKESHNRWYGPRRDLISPSSSQSGVHP